MLCQAQRCYVQFKNTRTLVTTMYIVNTSLSFFSCKPHKITRLNFKVLIYLMTYSDLHMTYDESPI
jgi:hypothetical protein